MDVSAQIHDEMSASQVNYSDIQGCWTGGGGNNICADPLFVDADGPDDVVGTEDDDLRLTAGSPVIDAGDTTALPLDEFDCDGDGNTVERLACDLDGNPRILDDPATADTGIPGSSVVDMGAYEFSADCNSNAIPDECDIACGTTGVPCDLPDCGLSADCNANDIPDECDIAECAGNPACADCNSNGVPDECDAATPVELAKLTASDGEENDNFGYSVAADGSRAVLGAWGDDDNGSFSGSAYVFGEVAGTWQQLAKLTASNGQANDWFGYGVSISADTALVGSPFHDDGTPDGGAAYVFRDVSGTWQQIAEFTSSDVANEDWFGWSVSLSGTTAVLGAPQEDAGGVSSGSAYVFREIGGSWQQIAKLVATDAAAGDNFGWGVSIDGDTAVVGAPADDVGGADGGSAYVFREIGGVWQQIAKLTAADAAANDQFGWSVSLSGDTAVVGAYLDDDAGNNSGSAYVFREIGGVWQQVAKLVPADGAAGDFTGESVSISGDTAVVGSRLHDDPADSSGSAYVFRDVGGTWQQIARLTAGDAAAFDNFGVGVAISGETIVVGSFGDETAVPNSGSAYVFSAIDCNANGVPDECEPDCNTNGLPDDCDLCVAGGRPSAGELCSADCNASGVPDECEQAGNDCDGNAVPDECDPDCNTNSRPDKCDIREADGGLCTVEPCSNDCQPNGKPDECDLSDGTSNDENGNGIPDECECGVPLPADPPHDRRKNRFISFVPNNTAAVAFRVELLDLTCVVTGRKCSFDSDCRRCVGGTANGDACVINSECQNGGTCEVSGEACVGPVMPVEPVVLGWVGDPIDDPGESPPGTVTARVVDPMPAPRAWTESTIHVGDCEIAPVQTYALSCTTDGVVFSERLVLATIDKPSGKNWADVVGSFDGTEWSPSNYLVNVDDVLAWVKYVTLKPAPHITVVDLDGERPNFVINATDLQFILAAFLGKPYPPPSFANQGTPADCP